MLKIEFACNKEGVCMAARRVQAHKTGHLLLELFDFFNCLLADALTLSLASLPV